MIGIFYGSTMGNTEAAANSIAQALSIDAAQVHNVGDTGVDAVAQYDTLLLGSSTWGAGDLQDDWYDFLDALKAQDLSGKRVALFGCGDSDSYPDTFCNAMAQIFDGLAETGATFVGAVDASSYPSAESDAVRDGHFVGLALDDADTDSHEERIAAWVAQF